MCPADLDGRGCVSGAQIQGIREYTQDGSGGYDFDKIDGYDEMG